MLNENILAYTRGVDYHNIPNSEQYLQAARSQIGGALADIYVIKLVDTRDDIAFYEENLGIGHQVTVLDYSSYFDKEKDEVHLIHSHKPRDDEEINRKVAHPFVVSVVITTPDDESEHGIRVKKTVSTVGVPISCWVEGIPADTIIALAEMKGDITHSNIEMASGGQPDAIVVYNFIEFNMVDFVNRNEDGTFSHVWVALLEDTNHFIDHLDEQDEYCVKSYRKAINSVYNGENAIEEIIESRQEAKKELIRILKGD